MSPQQDGVAVLLVLQATERHRLRRANGINAGENGQQPSAIMTWAAPLHGASSTHREAVGSHNAQPTTLSTRVA